MRNFIQGVLQLRDPPKMSRTQYARYRLRLVLILFAWGCFSALCFGYWNSMGSVVKALCVVVEYVLIPDPSLVMRLFVPYERYVKE
jgi:hypothetical protein